MCVFNNLSIIDVYFTDIFKLTGSWALCTICGPVQHFTPPTFVNSSGGIPRKCMSTQLWTVPARFPITTRLFVTDIVSFLLILDLNTVNLSLSSENLLILKFTVLAKYIALYCSKTN